MAKMEAGRVEVDDSSDRPILPQSSISLLVKM